MSDPNNLIGTGARILVEKMGEAATKFLAALAPDQQRKAALDFPDQECRTRWYYTPNARDGLPLDEMDRHQRQLAHALAATGVSRSGYVAASTIMGLETTLDAIEGWLFPEPGRDPGKYYLTIFGSPSAQDPWGWRFEGHHVSLNYTIVKGQIVSPTPTFFGSNPAEAPLGSATVLRPLAGVEDLARALLHDLNEEQLTRAILSDVAPTDILIANRPQVIDVADTIPGAVMMGETWAGKRRSDFEAFEQTLGWNEEAREALRYQAAHPKGLSFEAMNADQQAGLLGLIKEYLHRLPEEIAEIELAKVQQHGLAGVHFAWAGGIERRQPHYYRLQGPRFLVEYDNTQNDANHIHSVWRDPEDDFGAQILAQHYAAHKH